MEKTLAKIGLDNNEIKIYLTLLKEGALLAGTIADKTQIHRRTVYDALNKLLKKGIITYSILNGKKHFQAVNPDRLLLFLKEKKTRVEEEEKEVTNILQQLKELFKTPKTRIHAEIFTGKEGVKSVMELILKEKKEWLSIGATGTGLIVFPFYLKHFSKKREKLKIKRKVLIAQTKEGKEYFKELKKQKFVNVKFLPKNIKQPQTIWVFGDKIAILLVSLDQPIVFLIDNNEISNSFKDYFNWMWRK